MKYWNHQFPSFDDSRLSNVNGNLIIIINKQVRTAIDTENEGKEIQQIGLV